MLKAVRFGILAIFLLTAMLTFAACQDVPAQYDEADSGLISYKTTDNGDLTLEVLYPTKRTSRKNPTVLAFFGGGWISGSREDFLQEFEPLITSLRENGITVIGVDYRYALDGLSVRDCLDDCEAALKYLMDHAAQYDIDKSNLGVIGYSAGAHLALMTAIETKDAVKCCVSMSGPTILPSGYESDYFSDMLEYYCDIAMASMNSAERVKISPAAKLGKRCRSNFLLVNGLADTVVPAAHAELFCKEALSMRLNAELMEIEGMTHSYASYDRFDILCADIAAYMLDIFEK